MADDSATMALHQDTITVAAASVTHASPSALGGHDQGDLAHELYMLSTNFLLYVALVIVTAMLQRIYFPETFERPAQPPSDVEYYSVPAPGGGGGEDGEDGEDAKNQDAASLLPPKRSGKKPQRSVSWSTLAQVVDVTAGPDNETLTKKDVFGRLVACFFGLNVPFVIWGVMQERLLTRPYRGEYFIYSYGLVFLNRCISFVISGGLMLAVKPNLSSSITYEFSFPSVTNMLSSWCQYEALKYVTFPTQQLFKCFKIVPIMLMGKFLGNKSYEPHDYAVGGLIGVGIAIFMTSTESLNLGVDSFGQSEESSGTLCGIVLLLLFLAFDSFTGQWQSRMFQKAEKSAQYDGGHDMSSYEMMFMVSTFSMIFSFITLVHTHELEPAITFVYHHPEMHMHIVVFSVCSTVGQLFIFRTIKHFGAVVFAIIMNIRIMFSILLSCVIYSHTIPPNGFFGLFLVFAAVGYRVKRKAEGGTLIRWKGYENAKGQEFFHELHEHLDM